MAILPYLEDGFQVTGIAMSPNSSGTNVHKTITARECPGDASLSDTPTLHQGATQHCRLARESWEKLQALKACKRVELDGESLDVASVVAVAKYALTQALIAITARVDTELPYVIDMSAKQASAAPKSSQKRSKRVAKLLICTWRKATLLTVGAMTLVKSG